MKNLFIVVAISAIALACFGFAQEGPAIPEELIDVPWVKTNNKFGVLPVLSFCVNPKRVDIPIIKTFSEAMACLFVPPETLQYNQGLVAVPPIQLPAPLPPIDITQSLILPFLNQDQNYEQLICSCIYGLNPELSESAGESSSVENAFPLPSYDGKTDVPIECTCKDRQVSNLAATNAEARLPVIDRFSALPDEQSELTNIRIGDLQDIENLIPINCACGWPFKGMLNDLISQLGTNQSWLICKCDPALAFGVTTAVIEGTSITMPVVNTTLANLDLTVPALDVPNIQNAVADVVFPDWSAFLPFANATVFGDNLVVTTPPFFNVTAQVNQPQAVRSPIRKLYNRA